MYVISKKICDIYRYIYIYIHMFRVWGLPKP